MLVRLAIGLLLVAALGCFAGFVATRDRQWLRRMVILLRWTVIAGLGFFAVLLLERLALVL